MYERELSCAHYSTLFLYVLSLMSPILKILLKVILKRNKHKIEYVISEIQSGFMAGKGTREGITQSEDNY